MSSPDPNIALAARRRRALRGAGLCRRRRLRRRQRQEGKGPAYFGFVRDHRGSPVSDAHVCCGPRSGEPVVLKSNVLGLYRSHVSKEVPPDDVEVSCEKDRLQAGARHAPHRAGRDDMHIETNCTLQRL